MFITMTPAVYRLLCVPCAFAYLTACAPIVAVIGYGGPAMQIAVQLDRIKLVGDGVSYFESGKTITDHAVSKIAGADCRLLNVVTPDPVCKPQNSATQNALNARVTLAAAGDDWFNNEPSMLSRHAANGRETDRAGLQWDDADAER